jgi:hypothetical protein
MPEPAKNITNLRPPEQVFEQKEPLEPWLRQKNEPAAWFMRFKRYLDMGTKRSLRALVAAEPGTQKATKGTEKKLSDVSVPGSWKRASKLWHWVERAAAYDVAQVEKQAAHIRMVVTKLPFASKSYRIIQLSTMATTLLEQGKSGMSLDDFFTYTTRMQSLMRDIARELEGMDKATATMADAAAHKHLLEIAEKESKRK